MTKRKLTYIFIVLLLSAASLFGQEDIRREVKLYNPFKPSLSKAGKLNFFPEIEDTSAVFPDFNYSINPRAFIPEYEIKAIRAARLEPDPLPNLYKGYLNVGFGNYFSPYGELSISSKRSRKGMIGAYIRHESSFGKISVKEDTSVFAGYMDNTVRLFGTRLMRRAAFSALIDFDHMRRYAYGGDPAIITSADIDKDSLKIDYFNPRASLNIYSTRLDSNYLDYDIKLYYDLLFQTSIYYQHLAGINTDLGLNLKAFFLSADLAYEYSWVPNVEDKARHLVSFKPAISKNAPNWSFKLGMKLQTDSRYHDDGINPIEYNTKLYLYPDVKFKFRVIPSFVSLFVGLDGNYENNNATDIIYTNPFVISQNPDGQVIPSDQLYNMRPSDNKLRVHGGLLGSAGEYSTYKLTASYTLFEDMLFVSNDLFQGRGFIPYYDSGELLKLRAEVSAKLNEKMIISGLAHYYNYKMETFEKPWNKPSWDGKLSFKYNLRNKILANADLYGLSKRFVEFGPMPYSGATDPELKELPVFFALNLGIEYRYTRILSFWTRLNNLSISRYSDLNFYPSQRFLFMAGFTYSL